MIEPALDFLEKGNTKLKQKIAVMESLLAEHTAWKPGRGLLPTTKPGHGPCCTCQDCGHDYDECVCAHNEIEKKLQGC